MDGAGNGAAGARSGDGARHGERIDGCTTLVSVLTRLDPQPPGGPRQHLRRGNRPLAQAPGRLSRADSSLPWVTSGPGQLGHGSGGRCPVRPRIAVGRGPLEPHRHASAGAGGAARDCHRHGPGPALSCPALAAGRAALLDRLAGLAIGATDLAELIGTAIGIKLIFGIPLGIGVLLTGFDVLLILWLQQRAPLSRGSGRRPGAARGHMLRAERARGTSALVDDGPGLVPHGRVLTDRHMAYLAVGIVGATGHAPQSIPAFPRSANTPLPARAARAPGGRAAGQRRHGRGAAAGVLRQRGAAGAGGGRSACSRAHREVGIEQAQRLLAPLLGAGAAPVCSSVWHSSPRARPRPSTQRWPARVGHGSHGRGARAALGAPTDHAPVGTAAGIHRGSQASGRAALPGC